MQVLIMFLAFALCFYLGMLWGKWEAKADLKFNAEVQEERNALRQAYADYQAEIVRLNKEYDRLFQAQSDNLDQLARLIQLAIDRSNPTKPTPYASDKRMIVVDGKLIDRASCIEEDGKIVAVLNFDGIIEDVN